MDESRVKTSSGESTGDMGAGGGEAVVPPRPDETYVTSGGRNSFHGVTYQLKLLMLFVLRAMSNGYPAFRLATEMDAAGKLDDVVFSYPKNKDATRRGLSYRFLQAKHTSANTEIKKIGAADLMNDSDGDFSLLKYFRSYVKIVNNRELIGQNDEVEDVIICTNMGFRYGSRAGNFTLSENSFEKVRDDSGEAVEDDILPTVLLKFRDRFVARDYVISMLRKHFTKFPSKFAECVLGETEYVHEDAVEGDSTVHESYENAFREEVVDTESKTLREDFIIDSKSLSVPARHFRDALAWEYFKSGESREEALWSSLRGKTLKFTGLFAKPDPVLERTEKVAKKLVDLLRRNRDSKLVRRIDGKSVVAKSVDSLKLLNALQEEGGKLKFSERFLEGEGLPGQAKEFRQHLSKQLAYFDMSLGELAGYRFGGEDCPMIRAREQNECLLPDALIGDFLKKLAFAVDQPSETDLDEILMEEIGRRFERKDVRNAYHNFQVRMLNWMKEREGRYFTQEEAKEFFEGLKRENIGPITFDLKDPVITFTGRKRELDQLDQALHSGEFEGSDAVISRSVSISGLGGVGKSELVRMYAKLHRSEFHNTVWVNAENSATAESSFRRLAFDRLGILRKNANGDEKRMESIVEEVYQHLKGKENLFIFDNANQFGMASDNDQGIQSYLPPTSTGGKNYLIITSRNREWGNVKVLDIGSFTDEEAIDFFKQSIGYLEDYDKNKSLELSTLLGNFPLTMQQASSFIKETKKLMSNVGENFLIGDYMAVFVVKSKTLLDHEYPKHYKDSYMRTTFTTWKITLDYIYKEKYGKLAIKILHIMSYLSPDKIESSILSEILNGASKLELASALQLLKRYTMISMVDSTASIHRLVQLVTRIGLQEGRMEEETLNMVLNVADKLDINHSMSVWNFAERYTELVKKHMAIPYTIMENIIRMYRFKLAEAFGRKCVRTLGKLNGSAQECVFKINGLIGLSLEMEGKFNESLGIFSSNHEKQKVYFGECHPETLRSETEMANVFSNQGKYENAQQILYNVLEKQKKTLPPFHPDILESELLIGSTLNFLGQYEDAFKFFREVESRAGDILGPSHWITSTAKMGILMNPAKLMNSTNIPVQTLKKITDLFRQIFEKHNKSLFQHMGKNDFRINSEVLRSLGCHSDDDYNLTDTVMPYYGFILRELGALDEAFKTLSESYEKSKSKLGKKNNNTLFLMEAIANVMNEQGDISGALSRYNEVYAIRREIQGISHPDTIRCLMHIGHHTRKLGNHREAAEILKRVYGELLSRHGEKNMLTIRAGEEYALALSGIGNHVKAHRILSSVYETQKSMNGKEAPKSLSLGLEISSLLIKMGEREKSLEIVQEIQELMRTHRGEKDMTDLLLISKIAECLYELEKFEEAYERYIHLYNLQKIFNGENDRDTVLTKSNVAMTLIKLGKFEDAHTILKEVYDHQISHLGMSSTGTLSTMAAIGSVLLSQGRLDEAHKQYEDVLSKHIAAFGHEDIGAFQIRAQIALIFSEQGKIKKALNALEKCYSKFAAELGEDNSETLSIKFRMAVMLLKQSKHDQAQKCLFEIYGRQKATLGERHPMTAKTKEMLEKTLRRKQ